MSETELSAALDGIARRRGHGGFTFDDLARIGRLHKATIGQVADWLAQARRAGHLEDMGFDTGIRGLVDGPRRYRLATSAGEGDEHLAQAG